MDDLKDMRWSDNKDDFELVEEIMEVVSKDKYSHMAGEQTFNCLINLAVGYAALSPPEFRQSVKERIGEIFSYMLDEHVKLMATEDNLESEYTQ